MKTDQGVGDVCFADGVRQLDRAGGQRGGDAGARSAAGRPVPVQQPVEPVGRSSR